MRQSLRWKREENLESVNNRDIPKGVLRKIGFELASKPTFPIVLGHNKVSRGISLISLGLKCCRDACFCARAKPVSITVKELGIKGWLKGER